MAHNLHEKFGHSQFGGTFWITSGHASIHIALGDRNPSKLGHWVSCSLLGLTGKQLHVIFAYWPCSNTSGCLRSVCAQHCQFFDSQQRYVCPRTAFLDDLGLYIANKCLRGDAILLLADMNGDIRHPTLSTFATSHQLHELILQKFPTLPLPATFYRGAARVQFLLMEPGPPTFLPLMRFPGEMPPPARAIIAQLSSILT